MYAIKYDEGNYSRHELAETIDDIYNKYIAELKYAYKPLKSYFKDIEYTKFINYIVEQIIKADIEFPMTPEYRRLLAYILNMVGEVSACKGFGKWEEDLLDYTDKYGRVDQALNIIVGGRHEFGYLIELYSKQLEEYYVQ